jgi:tetratricopeptide (TPR) repeat protein
VDKILPSSDDPLFSIFIIIVLVLLTAVVSYLMGSYREDRKKRSLESFLGKIDSCVFSLDMEKIPFEASLISPLSSLAGSLADRGEYQRSIGLYLHLIKHIEEFTKKEYLLESLGKTYLKAGFLQRSEMIFLEILHKHPRNSEALYYLEIVYELLGEYDKAKETLVPLKVLGVSARQLESNLNLLTLLKKSNFSEDKKFNRLVEYLKTGDYSYRRVVQELFRLDPERAWAFIDDTKAHLILDILWLLPTLNLNLDIISKSDIFKSVYVARAILPLEGSQIKSDIFAIDVMVSALKSGTNEMDLTFSYLCKRCKQTSPISFIRCPQCYALDSISLKESIVKKHSFRGYSLL